MQVCHKNRTGTQETRSSALSASTPLALGTSDHFVPSEVSTSAWCPLAVSLVPTAAHEPQRTHETPSSSERVLPPGFGLSRMDQSLPSQDSTRVPLPARPTATQRSALTHDTPFRWVDPPAPLGLGTNDHSLPFQDSTRELMEYPWAKSTHPTATQNVAETHETPVSTSSSGAEQSSVHGVF